MNALQWQIMDSVARQAEIAARGIIGIAETVAKDDALVAASIALVRANLDAYVATSKTLNPERLELAFEALQRSLDALNQATQRAMDVRHDKQLRELERIVGPKAFKKLTKRQ